MQEGVQLKYGIIKGEDFGVKLSVPMGASEVIKAASGRFVKNDASGRMEIAVAGSTLLMGWVELGEQTCSATEGGTVACFYPAWGAQMMVFRIPINTGTYAATMIGKTCDLSVVSSIQGAALGASSEDTIIIVGGDLDNNKWVDVMIAPNKLTSFTGVV